MQPPAVDASALGFQHWPPSMATPTAMSNPLPLPTRSSDEQFSQLVESARGRDWRPSDVARLAAHLAASGDRISWPTEVLVADIASTGGPGSLSTLLAPLVLRARGASVVKLGVPGRPAGAVDSLATLPGYRARLNAEEVRAVISRCGFAHFLADERFAPMDAALYQYRRSVGAVALPVLAAASLLAKKLAVGVRAVGLDVRVAAHGNFGHSASEARKNSRLFCAAASEVGVTAVALISPADGPPQPWVGRGEALLALAAFVGVGPSENHAPWLQAHFDQCVRMADETMRAAAGNRNSPAQPPDCDLRTATRAALEAHLEAQGTTLGALADRARDISAAERLPVRAASDGVLQIDLGTLRVVLVEAQADHPTQPFHDPAGVTLMVKSGERVSMGDTLAGVRCDFSRSGARALLERLRPAFKVIPREASAARAVTEGGEFEMEVIHA